MNTPADHYEVFVQSNGRTLYRTCSESLARLLAESRSTPLDYVAVDSAGRDIPTFINNMED